MYLLGFGFPIILTFMLGLFGVNCTYIQNICIYGYSVTIVIICVLLCSINSCLLHIILLGYAFVTRALFIMNNFNAGYQIPLAKKTLMMGLIIGENALQFFVVRFFFIKCVEETQTTTQTSGVKNHLENWFHSRTFVV